VPVYLLGDYWARIIQHSDWYGQFGTHLHVLKRLLHIELSFATGTNQGCEEAVDR